MNDYPDYDVRPLQSISDLFGYACDTFRDYVLFYGNGQEITYGDAKEMVWKLIYSLKDFKRKKILISATDKMLFSVAYFAVVMSDNIAVLCPKSVRLPVYFGEDGIAHVLDDDGIRRSLSSSSYFSNYELSSDTNQVCTILFSSGTSSVPKGIKLSQRNICSDIVAGMQKYEYCEKSVYHNILPLYHAFGLVCDLLAPVYSGGTICFSKDSSGFLSDMARFRPTCINAPPIVAQSILSLSQKIPLDVITGGRLRKILCGGAQVDGFTASSLQKAGVFISGCYGMSECSPCISVNRDEFYKHGSAGVPLNCNQIRLENDQILIKGSNVMLGYCGSQDETKPLRDGWLYTGDLGYFDSDGFLYLTGRMSNMMVFSDGTKCVPEEIERCLNSLPGVKESLVYSDPEETEKWSVCVVCDDSSSGLLIDPSLINAFIRSMNNIDTSHFSQKTSVSDKPLVRNSNGKVRRTNNG